MDKVKFMIKTLVQFCRNEDGLFFTLDALFTNVDQ